MAEIRSKCKILYIITRMIVGGAQRVVLDALNSIDHDSFEPILAFGPQTGPEGSTHEEARSLGIPVYVIPHLVREIQPWNDLIALIEIVKLLRRERVDVVHTHSSKAGILGRIAAKIAGVPTVVHTVHGWGFTNETPFLLRKLYTVSERKMSRFTDALILLSEEDKRKGLSCGIGRESTYHVLGQGIHVERFRRGEVDRHQIRLNLALPASGRIVGSAMRLVQQKDPITFVRMAKRITDVLPDVVFAVAGDGPLRKEVQGEIQRLGLNGKFVLLGLRHDIPSLLPAFDVFVLTSRWEGLPLVILEAMASGCPIVATGVDGTKEIIRDGENGFLAPPAEPEQLAQMVVRVLEEHGMRERIIERAFHTVQEFDFPNLMKRMENLYSSLRQRREKERDQL